MSADAREVALGVIRRRYRREMSRTVADALSHDVADALEAAGLLAPVRCTCPVGFGQVRAVDCPRHGRREPEHTIATAPGRRGCWACSGGTCITPETCRRAADA